jgi:FOG: CheY-like receiver
MTTHSVSGGAQALEVLAAGGPPAAGFDLALLDFSMPEMNGLELARRLRAEGRPGLPLILLTSSGDQVAAARAAGVTGVRDQAGAAGEAPKAARGRALGRGRRRDCGGRGEPRTPRDGG